MRALSLLFLFIFGSCASIFNSKKQQVTFTLPASNSKLYIGDSLMGQGQNITVAVPKKQGTQQLRVDTEGSSSSYGVLMFKNRSLLRFIPVGLGLLGFVGASAAQNPDVKGVLTVAAFGVVSTGFMMAFFDRGTRAWQYPKTIQLKAGVPVHFKKEAEKYIVIDKTAFNVPKDKFLIKTANGKQAVKNRELADKKATSRPFEDADVKVDNTIFTDQLNLMLKKYGFIDTTKTILKSKLNTLYLEAEVSEFVHWRYSAPGAMADGFCNIGITIKWTALDIYGQPKFTKTLEVRSGDFAYFYSSGVVNPANMAQAAAQMAEGQKKNAETTLFAMQNAFEKSFFEFIGAPEMQKLLPKETGSTTDNLPNIALAKPTKTPQNFEDGIAASATILVEKSEKEKGHGSGFFVSHDGYLLTNFHVVAGMKKIEVKTNDGKTYAAKVIRQNEENDLALLKIEANSAFAFEIPTEKNYNIGMEIYAIGTPSSQDLNQTLSKGIISGARKGELGNDILQTDVGVNFGNSGGALVNKNVQLVGVVNSKLMGMGVEGIAFGSAAKDIFGQLKLSY